LGFTGLTRNLTRVKLYISSFFYLIRWVVSSLSKRKLVFLPAKEMTKGHAANVQGFKLMNVLTLMLGYEATKLDRLKDEATILALTSNDSM